MERVLIAVVLAGIVVAIALILQRRRPDAPAGGGGRYEAPGQLDRADFDRPDAPWLVVAFTSSTCDACADVWSKCQVLASDQVAV